VLKIAMLRLIKGARLAFISALIMSSPVAFGNILLFNAGSTQSGGGGNASCLGVIDASVGCALPMLGGAP
jgi:hypothetical protein